MKIIYKYLASILLLFSLACLFALASKATRYEALILAQGKAGQEISLEKVDEFEGLLTYETHAEGTIKTTKNISAKIIGTNYRYKNIMGFQMLSGGYFTENAQIQRSKHAVLNENLAFEAFGSYDIIGSSFAFGNDLYNVVGVIRDGQDENVMYAPAILLAESSSSFLGKYDVPDAFISEIKTYGIFDSKFDVIDLGGVAGSVANKPLLSIWILVVVLIVISIWKIFVELKKVFSGLKASLLEKYFGEMIRSRVFWSFVVWILVILSCFAIVIFALSQCVWISLEWYSLGSAFSVIFLDVFDGSANYLRDLVLYSNIAFIVFLGGVLLVVFEIIAHKQKV